MSSEPSLAIECSSFSILGSSGEATFGNPKPITVHPDLYQWSEGLKRDGGAGCVFQWRLCVCVCVLKERLFTIYAGTFLKIENCVNK